MSPKATPPTHMPPAAWPPDAPSWLRGKSIEELEAFEHGERVLIPEALRRRGPKGEEILVPVALRVPTEHERAQARIDAIRFVQELRKKAGGPQPPIETVEQAQAAVGADVFENFDTFAILARALREPKAPHGPAYTLDVLVGSFQPSALFDLYFRLDFYSRLYNPRIEELDDESFWAAVSEVARVRNLGPLAVIAGSAQNAFILRSIVELSNCRTRLSSSPSSETLTPGS